MILQPSSQLFFPPGGVRVIARGGAAVYSIAGIVYDADGTTAVAGATVALGAYSAVSGADGTYTITGIPPGESGSMTCTLAGYSWTAITVAAMSGNLTAQNYTNAWWAGGGVANNIVQAYQPEGAASLADSYLRIAGSGGNANLDPAVVGSGLAPTWSSANGWVKASAGAAWLNTGITPVTGHSYLVKYANSNTGDVYVFGEYTANAAVFAMADIGSADKVRYGNGGQVDVTPSLTEGVLIIAGANGYRNGILDTAAIPAWSAAATVPIYLMRRNRTTLDQDWTGYFKAYAEWDTVLTPTQVQIITEATSSPFEPTPVSAGEFMIAHITDTHYEDAEGGAIHIEHIGRYLAEHAASLGIEIVLHSGDIVNPPVDGDGGDGHSVTQWQAASDMLAELDAVNLPYLLTTGNHDYDGDIGSDVIGRASTEFNTYFPQSRYTSKTWWNGGFYEASHSENAYLLMTIDSVDYIFISMEFGPRDAVMTWVDGLLTTYAARHAVIITHSYIYRDGTTVAAGDQYAPHPDYTLDGDSNNGDELLVMFQTHDNVRLVLSGHDKATLPGIAKSREDLSNGGIPIIGMVANYQQWLTYKSGMMRFLRVNPTATTIKVESFSARLNQFLHDADNQFTVDWTP